MNKKKQKKEIYLLFPKHNVNQKYKYNLKKHLFFQFHLLSRLFLVTLFGCSLSSLFLE